MEYHQCYFDCPITYRRRYFTNKKEEASLCVFFLIGANYDLVGFHPNWLRPWVLGQVFGDIEALSDNLTPYALTPCPTSSDSP
jgi:hypothetical protein